MFANKEVSGIIIAGGGRIGCCLAEQLNKADENLTVIDINCESFKNLMPDFSGSIFEGDASNIDVLRQAGINRARAVIAATGNDNINLMIAQIAREIYEVSTVIAVVKDLNILAAKAEFDFLILCPTLAITLEVIQDLQMEEG